MKVKYVQELEDQTEFHLYNKTRYVTGHSILWSKLQVERNSYTKDPIIILVSRPCSRKLN